MLSPIARRHYYKGDWDISEVDCIIVGVLNYIDMYDKFRENYCFIQNTYWVPYTDNIPHRLEEREKSFLFFFCNKRKNLLKRSF